LIVDEMAPLVSTTEVMDIDIDYWGTHNLDFIPPYLLNRIHELGKYEIVNPPITDMYEFNTEFYERSKESSSVFRVSTFLHPMYSKLYPELMERGVKIYLVLSQEVLDSLRDKPDPDFEKLLENNLFNLFIYPKKAGLLTFAYNDYYLLTRLLKNNGETDQTHLFFSSPSALEWGKELFEYYLKDSTPITKIK
jgi:predicted transcriptional regulator